MKAQADPARGETRTNVATMTSAVDGRRILRLHLNRPEKRNALSLVMLENLHRCLAQEVEEIIITSAGSSFCAGLDLDECRNDNAWPRPIRHLESLASVYRGLLSSPATIIAIVQGFAVGGGVGLAACADVVIAASNARLRLPEAGELAAMARIVQPVIEARQIARRGMASWQAGELDARVAQLAGLIDEIVEADALAQRCDEVLSDCLRHFVRPPSWRQPQRCRTIEDAMRAILISLSR
jgi:enoyl-CoA hydratase/carnithine racemase